MFRCIGVPRFGALFSFAALRLSSFAALNCPVNTLCVTGNHFYKDERDLTVFLLKDYDVRARPVLDSSRPVNLSFGITPIQLTDLVRMGGA